MIIAGWAGIFASILGLALTIYGVFYNGRKTRELISAMRIDADRRHDGLLTDADRRHQELLTYLRDMDRRHTEILAEIAKRG